MPPCDAAPDEKTMLLSPAPLHLKYFDAIFHLYLYYYCCPRITTQQLL